MRWGKTALIILGALVFPFVVQADILINEVAWMGTSESANDEWMELRNISTESVDVSGWVLEALDGSPLIALSGSIDGSAFFLLERTDDDSVPGIVADQIYSGALGNTGETLVLKDSANIEIDRLAGGDDWETIGGDNLTKHTAQRQDDGTWITGVPTPRATNSTEDTSGGGGSGGGGDNTPTEVVVFEATSFISGGGDRIVVVGADVEYEALVVNEKNRATPHGMVEWAFGDGAHDRGDSVFHKYRHPGLYAVTVSTRKGDQTLTDSFTVEAVVGQVEISSVVFGKDGYVELSNKSSEVDLSNWRIEIDDRNLNTPKAEFVIPEGTRILKESGARLPNEVTGLGGSLPGRVYLKYPDSIVFYEYDPDRKRSEVKVPKVISKSTEELVTPVATPATAPSQKYENSPRNISVTVDRKIRPFASTSISTSSLGASVLVAGDGSGLGGGGRSWIVLLSAIVLGAALGAVFLVGKPKSEVEKIADKITIIE